jgi:topoisomerase-4 subunit B
MLCLITSCGIVRDEKQKAAEFSAGNLMLEEEVIDTTRERKRNEVTLDEAIF